MQKKSKKTKYTFIWTFIESAEITNYIRKTSETYFIAVAQRNEITSAVSSTSLFVREHEGANCRAYLISFTIDSLLINKYTTFPFVIGQLHQCRKVSDSLLDE